MMYTREIAPGIYEEFEPEEHTFEELQAEIDKWVEVGGSVEVEHEAIADGAIRGSQLFGNLPPDKEMVVFRCMGHTAHFPDGNVWYAETPYEGENPTIVPVGSYSDYRS